MITGLDHVVVLLRDIEAGVAAEIATVWISHGQPKTFTAQPRHTVRDLLELTDWLQQLSAS